MNIINRMNISNIKKFISPSLCIGWCLLGFYRGQNSYDYRYSKDYYKYESYLYSQRIIHGFFGMAMYALPVFIFITIPKELFRLEVNIRNLEYEKNEDYYNKLD
jgi:hypothetical protein